MVQLFTEVLLTLIIYPTWDNVKCFLLHYEYFFGSAHHDREKIENIEKRCIKNKSE